jgi:catechol 2,3-dioxygenase-like lactoylglutathione lyase family enzyme
LIVLERKNLDMSSDAQKSNPLPLGINGLDHVRILVHDLEATKDLFRDVLGFYVSARGDNYIHPLGTFQTFSRFTNGFMLEYMAIHDRPMATVERPEMVHFLDHWEGGHSVVLNVTSTQETSEMLRARGFPVTAPVPGTRRRVTDDPSPSPPRWWLVNFESAPFPPYLLSFIQYQQSWEELRAARAQESRHPNTATRVLAVWMAVPDAEATAQYFTSLGLPSQRTVQVPRLGAIAQEIRVGENHSLLLLQSLQPEGEVGRFVKERGGAGIVGVSLEVTDLETAATRLAQGNIETKPSYPGVYGKSLLVPAECARGLWIELVAR